MNLTKSDHELIKDRRYGMYSFDGDLRVAHAIIDDLERGESCDNLWDRVKRIQEVVLRGEHGWCAEVGDTVVEECIFVILEQYLT